jgi:hypothetical protein
MSTFPNPRPKRFRALLFTLTVAAAAVVIGEAMRKNAIRGTVPPAADNARGASVNLVPAGVHDNLTLDESTLSAAEGRLTFAQLEQWDFSPGRSTAAPATLQALENREMVLSGFMFPLEAGKRLHHFCLLKTTQTCCYGPMPQFNQYVLVEMEKPVALVRERPVTVTGIFHLDPRPDEGYIYRMDGRALADAPAEQPRAIPQ